MAGGRSTMVSMSPGWNDPEAAWWAKLHRAAIHIAEVRKRYEAFKATKPWSVEEFPGEAPNERGFRLRVSAPVPAELVTVMGDAIHNMRSALDAVAYELAVRHVGAELDPEQEKATEFPITKGPEEFEAFFWERKRRPELYGDHERAALRCVQPFAISEEARALGVDVQESAEHSFIQNELARLHYLSIVHKHRRLPVLSWFSRLVYWSEPPVGATYVWRPGVTTGVSFEDGTVLGYLRDPNGDAPPESEVFHELDLTITDDPARFGQDLVSTLDAWHRYLSGWVLPRMMHVADGGAPPIYIGSAPG
jgi:hypothetical protein